jgi:hypothetical protein
MWEAEDVRVVGAFAANGQPGGVAAAAVLAEQVPGDAFGAAGEVERVDL